MCRWHWPWHLATFLTWMMTQLPENKPSFKTKYFSKISKYCCFYQHVRIGHFFRHQTGHFTMISAWDDDNNKIITKWPLTYSPAISIVGRVILMARYRVNGLLQIILVKLKYVFVICLTHPPWNQDQFCFGIEYRSLGAGRRFKWVNLVFSFVLSQHYWLCTTLGY